MRSLISISAILLASSAVYADSTTYRIHHRFLSHPSPTSPTPFQHLGNLLVQDTLTTLEDGPAGSDHQTDDGKGWYQVGVQLDQYDTQEEWLIGSTKACYLSTSPPKIQIHLTTSSIPSSISIIPHSSSISSCQSTSNSTISVKLPAGLNELTFDFIHKTYSPSLAPPPTVDPTTGSPAPPEVEKTFFQKYWMYIVGIALFFAIQMGPDEPRGGGAGGGGK
ncbi:hypothetical protein I204_03578 [Kwoniella mangroviensis CBS 8886]|nr:hypothetical protein I204_03578 [Kwoniella mangroviensis CBS 8886]